MCNVKRKREYQGDLPENITRLPSAPGKKSRERLRKIIVIAAAVAAALLLRAPAAGAQEAVNLSEENRAALADAVERLQQTELHRLNRGRFKPNPVLFPYHTIYQTVMQDQEYILDRQASAFRNSLLRLHKVFDAYPDVTPAAAGGADIFARFETELISAYSLKEEFAGEETVLGIWLDFEESGMRMDLLPLRAGFALNAARWLSRFYGGTIPPGLVRQLELVMTDKPAPGSLFEADAYLKELSARYSRLVMEAVAPGERSAPPAPEDGK